MDRRDIEFRRRLSRARTPSEIFDLACKEAGARFRGGSFNCLDLSGPVVSETNIVVWSDEWPPQDLVRAFFALPPDVSADFGGFELLFGVRPQCFVLNDHLDPRTFERTRLYQGLWKPWHLARHLMAEVGTPRRPLVSMSLARPARDGPFREREIRQISLLRDAVEGALGALRATPLGDLEAVLRAIGAGLPVASVLFDRAGRVLWISEEALLRLEVESARFGPVRFVDGRSPALQRLGSIARTMAAEPEKAVCPALAAPGRWVRPDETLVARVFRDMPHAPPVVLLTIAHARIENEPRRALRTPRPSGAGARLTSRETEVARLGAQGFGVEAIGLRLDIADHTVRTHLKHAYQKLGVHNRAELACRFLAQGEAGAAAGDTPNEVWTGETRDVR
jgi:DNA-binding CsgD family transcriptional regulator